MQAPLKDPLTDPFPFTCQGEVVLCKNVGCAETSFPQINVISKFGAIYANIVGGRDQYVDNNNPLI